jgi:AcrR family transcriptional regulator
MSKTSRDEILNAARLAAQAHGYTGLNIRGLADEVGIKAASIYYHFPSKAELGAAVAQRYWEDTARDLDVLRDAEGDALRSLSRYPQIFRRSLESGNRLCMGSFMMICLNLSKLRCKSLRTSISTGWQGSFWKRGSLRQKTAECVPVPFFLPSPAHS